MQGVKPVTRRDLGTWDGVRAERWSVGKPLTSPGAGDAAFHGLPVPNSRKTAQILLFYHQEDIFGW